MTQRHLSTTLAQLYNDYLSSIFIEWVRKCFLKVNIQNSQKTETSNIIICY